ncbi:MAG TPA: dienelactone hydrolase family protein [Candidatus Sulfotelmatobacter sp.]|nr:dienelactone hydrolase family protein [Candidatus Sulfotelmatobacter sp.]
MCFDTDSVPPFFAEAGRPTMPVDAAPVTLKSADGTSFAAFLARPERPSGAGVIVLPDFRGLFRFYELLAQRLAEQGHTALAIDYFGRTAGIGPRGEDFPFREHLMRVTRQGVDDDMAAAADYLRGPDGGKCKAVMALGFCFGGRQAFFASAAKFGLAGVIGFYGAPSFYPNGAVGPTQRAAELSAPILGLFGGADHGIPPSDVAAFNDALKAAGVEHEIEVYPGAPHSFFDVKYAEHGEACADAWRRVLRFIEEHLRVGSAA